MKNFLSILFVFIFSIPLFGMDSDSWQKYDQECKNLDRAKIVAGLVFSSVVFVWSMALVAKKI